MDHRPPDWKLIENVVAGIERSLNAVEGTTVIPNASVAERVSGVPRQVDVFVQIPTGPRMLRIGIEVRDKSAPVDLTEVEQLIAKLKKIDIDRGCIVSSSGFTRTAKDEAARYGIELRTLSEIEHPNWWRASTMTVEHRQIELLNMRINFADEHLAQGTALLADTKTADLEIVTNEESPSLLSTFVTTSVIAAINSQSLCLEDQTQFTVKIDFSKVNGSLRCPNGTLPIPESIDASCRLHRRVEIVPLTAYESSDRVNAFSGISSAWSKQIVMVTDVQSDGSRQMSIAADDPKPAKTKVDPRS